MKRLLVVVDYQVDFVTGALGFAGAEKMDHPIARRIEAIRAAGGDVVFTFDTHSAQYDKTQEGRKLPVPHCLKNSPGWELYGATGMARKPFDRCFEKPAFGSLEFANWLHGQAYTHIEFVGLVSNICVISNAVLAKAALPEAEIAVNSTLSASFDPLLHQKTMDVLAGMQVTVL